MSGSSLSELSPLDYQGIIRFGAMLESHYKLQLKPKSVPEVAIQLIWSASPEKASDNAVKDYRNPQVTEGMCVSQQ